MAPSSPGRIQPAPDGGARGRPANPDRPRLSLADVWQAVAFRPGPAPAEWTTHRVTSVVIDSREAEPGSLFVALPGERSDGHQYVAHAFSRGAIAAWVARPGDVGSPLEELRQAPAKGGVPDLPACLLVDDPLVALQEIAAFWRSRFSPRVIGVTGSVGKTTTKEVTAAVLSQRYVTLKNIGSLNNEIGLPLTLVQLNAGHQAVVLEMGMYDVGEIDGQTFIAMAFIEGRPLRDYTKRGKPHEAKKRFVSFVCWPWRWLKPTRRAVFTVT